MLRDAIKVAAIAVLTVALAMFEGGFAPEATAVVSLVVWWSVIVRLVGSSGPPTGLSRSAIVAGSALAGLTALVAASMIWAGDEGAAFRETNRIAAYLGLFVLVVITTRTGRAADLLRGVALGLAAVTAISLLARFEPNLLGGGADQDLTASLDAAQGRLSYPIGYWNGLAACLAIAATLLAWLGANGITRAARAAAPACLALVGLGLYLAGSRGGLAATAAGLAALLLLSRQRSRIFLALVPGIAGTGVLVFLATRRPQFVDALSNDAVANQGHEMLAASLIVVALVALAAYLLDPRWARIEVPRRPVIAVLTTLALVAVIAFIVSGPERRLDDFVKPSDVSALEDQRAAGHFDSSSGSGRYQFWRAAIDAFADRPVLGIGAGNYETYWSLHGTTGAAVSDAHSLYLETLAELGIVGGILLVCFLVAVVLGARESARERTRGSEVAAALGIVAAGAVSAAFDWTYEIPAAFAPVILAAALLTAGGTRRTALCAVHAGEPPPRRRGPFSLGVAVLLTAWAAIWVAGIVLVSQVRLEESRAAVGRQNLDAAAQDALDAATIQPWSADPYIQLAQVEQLRGDLDAAADAISEAIDRDHDDWRCWLVLAQVKVAAGDPAAARAALSQARELSPRPLPVSALSVE